MCQACDLQGTVDKRFSEHNQLDQYRSTNGTIMKGKGGTPKPAYPPEGKPHLATVQAARPVKNRFLVPSLVFLGCCFLLNSLGMFVPLVMILRNCISPKVPVNARPKYPQCSDQMLGKEMTIVVTVKDACSQAPGFIRALERLAPPSVHLIYSFPNFDSCA